MSQIERYEVHEEWPAVPGRRYRILRQMMPRKPGILRLIEVIR